MASSRVRSRWVVSIFELVVAAGIAVAAEHLFAEQVARVVEVIVPFAGFAVALSTLSLDFRVESSVKDAFEEHGTQLRQKLEQVIAADVRKTGDRLADQIKSLELLLPFMNFYLESSSADPLGFRARVLLDATGKLRKIAGGEIELEDALYYEWLTMRLRSGVKSVQAVNVRPLRVFETDPREEAFLEENHAAIERGAKVTRIYIIERSELFNETARRVLLDAYRSKVLCFVAWQDDLTPALLAEFRGGGLSIYDDADVFLDRSFLRYSYVADSAGNNLEMYAKLEACVFRSPHPKFNALRNAYQVLYDQFVPSALKVIRGNAEEAFCAVLKELLRRESGADPEVRQAIQAEIVKLGG